MDIKYNGFLIKYAEIGLKGKNRHVFEDKLLSNIRIKLNSLDIEYNIRKDQGRIYIEITSAFSYDEVVSKLAQVFGIVGICPMIEIEEKDYEVFSDRVVEALKIYKGDNSFTFKVETKRGDKLFYMSSMEVNAELGGKILDNLPNSKVDVKNPELMIHIEIRDKVYVYFQVIKGAGGMPVGTNGKAMLLLSGGIDSPVAGYMISKRGVNIDAIYFHAPPYTSERAKQKVVDLAKIVSKYCGTINLHVINFTEIQMAIYENCPHDELTIIMRRYMMKLAEHFARENKCLGLVTGESIGQVASQTMKSLYATDMATSLPVYRPLIGMDKQEIIDYSLKIGTYETSILPYEDCCTIFVAKHPVTKPYLKTIEKSEKNLDGIIEDMIQKAIDECEIIKVNE